MKILFDKSQEIFLSIPSCISEDKEKEFVEKVSFLLNRYNLYEKFESIYNNSAIKDFLKNKTYIQEIISPLFLSHIDSEDYCSKIEKFLNEYENFQDFNMLVSMKINLKKLKEENAKSKISFLKNSQNKIGIRIGSENKGTSIDIEKLSSNINKSNIGDIFIPYYYHFEDVNAYEILFKQKKIGEIDLEKLLNDILSKERYNFLDLEFIYKYEDIKEMINKINLGFF